MSLATAFCDPKLFTDPFNGNMQDYGSTRASFPAQPVPSMPIQDSLDCLQEQMNNMYLAPATIQQNESQTRKASAPRRPVEKKNSSKKRAGSASSTSTVGSKVEHGGVKKPKASKKATTANEQKKRQSALTREIVQPPPPQPPRSEPLPETPRPVPVAAKSPPKKHARGTGSNGNSVHSRTKVEHGGIQKTRAPKKAASANDKKRQTPSSNPTDEKPARAAKLAREREKANQRRLLERSEKKSQKQLIEQLEKMVVDGSVAAPPPSLTGPRTLRVQPERAARRKARWWRQSRQWGTMREEQSREARGHSGPARMWVDGELDAYVAFNYEAETRIRRMEALDFD